MPFPKTTSKPLLAACGMDCALCIAHQREKKPCAGCRGEIAEIQGHCQTCMIRNCPQNQDGGYCFACPEFPCKRLKALDARYRKNYGMSMVENLLFIAEHGEEGFMRQENERWACPSCGVLLSVYREKCQACGAGTNNRVGAKTKSKTNQTRQLASGIVEGDTMNEFTQEQLSEAHRALLSTLNKCEKMDREKLGKSQQTLLERRIAALKIALALIEKEQGLNGNDRPMLWLR
jgi:hypothetical protein